jgi:hypothetical protein
MSAGTKLGKVADAVVVVPGEAERGLHPLAQGHLGVVVVTAKHQDARMDEDQPVDERRHREAAVGPDEDRDADEDGGDLEKPGEAVMRMQARQGEEKRAHTEEDCGFSARMGHGRLSDP